MEKISKAEVAHMIEVESEHQDTYDYIWNILHQTGKLPTAADVFEKIGYNHIGEGKPRSREYYHYLDRMEACIDDDIPIEACFTYKRPIANGKQKRL